jgi:hypothetical protein
MPKAFDIKRMQGKSPTFRINYIRLVQSIGIAMTQAVLRLTLRLGAPAVVPKSLAPSSFPSSFDRKALELPSILRF